MAVVVRSVRQSGAALTRALTAAGVPVLTAPSGMPVAEQAAAKAMLTVLTVVADGLDGDRAQQLLTGPIGRVDPVTLRQLRRALRRADRSLTPRDFGDLLVEALDSEKIAVTGDLGRPLKRVRAVLDAARRSDADGADPRYTLWQTWQRSGLQKRWLAASERGGPAGAKADADLDSVTALFDVTEQYVSRTAGASLRGLVEHVVALGPAPASDDPSADSDGVTLVSAHAALGREWDMVVIAGLQEGLWPNTTPRGGVLGTQHLVDILDGVADDYGTRMSSRAPLIAEERRLLDRRDGPRPPPPAGDGGRQRVRRRLHAAFAVSRRALPVRDRRRDSHRRTGARPAGTRSRAACRYASRGDLRARRCRRRHGKGLRGSSIGTACGCWCRRRRSRAVVRHDHAQAVSTPCGRATTTWCGCRRRRCRRWPTARCGGCSNGTVAATAATCARRSAR